MSPFLILSLVFLAECGPKQDPATLEDALSLYRKNDLKGALPIFARLVAQERDNPDAHAWLAETHRRLGDKREAVRSARAALTLDPCHAFALTVIAEAVNPVLGTWEESDSALCWASLTKAVACDSTDGNPWLLIWGEGLHRGEYDLMRKSLVKFVETGFLTKTALAYGRWMLRTLPKNAVLVTNGDMDTYPPCAVQETEDFRTDVAVVNRGMLNTPWYSRFARDVEGVTLPFDDAELDALTARGDGTGGVSTPSDQIIGKWIDWKQKGLFNRPLCFAVTVSEDLLGGMKQNLRYAGAYYTWTDGVTAATPDTAAMGLNLTGTRSDEFTGSWISDQDRSPIRRVSTKNLVRNVTATAVAYGDALLKAGRSADALYWLDRASEIESSAEAEPMFTEEIARLRELITVGKSNR